TGCRGLTAECLQLLAVTRACTAACVLTTAAVQPELLGPFQPYCNLVSGSSTCGGAARPAYRPPLAGLGLVTNLPFFWPLGFGFFNVFRDCRTLEDGFFRAHKTNFVFLFLFGGVLMTILFFLARGQALMAMLKDVWSCCSPRVRVGFFGLLAFWRHSCSGLSLLLGNPILMDLLGTTLGHIYYFLEDVFPNKPEGKRLLQTPSFLSLLPDAPKEDPDNLPLPKEYLARPLRPTVGGRMGGQEAQEPAHACPAEL
uniref:Derlin n=1 Tax=Equus asinus TaxID=9793 RepID=A0A9L0K5D0_EQUAS